MLAGAADRPEVHLCCGFAPNSAVGSRLRKVGLEVPEVRLQQIPSGDEEPTRLLHQSVYLVTEGVMATLRAACEQEGAHD